MAKWMQALSRTRGSLMGGVSRIFSARESFCEEELDAMEDLLIGADIPARLAAEWVEAARSGSTDDSLRNRIAAAMKEAFTGEGEFDWSSPNPPLVVLIVGVNGCGKTTTTAKLASMLLRDDWRVLIAATDTFRAAGADQLRIWAERIGSEIVAGSQGQDAAAVAFDAVRAAVSRSLEVVLIDTAGRMHTREPLMEELRKMSRSIEKALPGAPHETWLVLDASLGNNALAQARQFHERIGVTGVIVSKLDGSAKAGFLLSVRRELQVPVYYAGFGEHEEDLVPFDVDAYVEGILG